MGYDYDDEYTMIMALVFDDSLMFMLLGALHKMLLTTTVSESFGEMIFLFEARHLIELDISGGNQVVHGKRP